LGVVVTQVFALCTTRSAGALEASSHSLYNSLHDDAAGSGGIIRRATSESTAKENRDRPYWEFSNHLQDVAIPGTVRHDHLVDLKSKVDQPRSSRRSPEEGRWQCSGDDTVKTPEGNQFLAKSAETTRPFPDSL